jgi:hypothetical protein
MIGDGDCGDPGLNPDRSGGKQATNRLSFGAALTQILGYTCLKLTTQPELPFLPFLTICCYKPLLSVCRLVVTVLIQKVPGSIPTAASNLFPMQQGHFLMWHEGRAVAQAVSRWLLTAVARVLVRASMWDLWWTKRHWGRVSLTTSVFRANLRSPNFSTILVTRG